MKKISFAAIFLLPFFFLFSPAWADVTLTFDTPIPGTIQDINGLGTGFTHRLPGTGSSLPANDPNLDLLSNPGRLTITSTHFDLNFGGVNLNIAETLGVKLSGIGTKDFIVSALFRDVQVHEYSDQLYLYVATASNKIFRGGMHSSNREYMLTQNNGGNDSGLMPFGHFEVGDDIHLTLIRVGGSTYKMLYENLTAGDSGSLSVTFHWLDSASDLYVGVLYANNAGKVPNNPKTSQIDEFSVYSPLFDSLDIKRGTINIGKGTIYLKGQFVLKAGSDGLNLAVDDVEVKLQGSDILNQTIPAGSFVSNKKGTAFKFKATRGSTGITKMVITKLKKGENRYRFRLICKGLDLSGLEGNDDRDITLSLSIGNDAGSITQTYRRNKKGDLKVP